MIKSHLFLSEEKFKGILAKHQHVTSKAAIDFLLEETLPIQRNELSWKFVNRKHSEAMLQRKKDINSKNKVFVTTHYAHTIVFCGVSVRICKGKVGSANFYALELLC